jgi:hypothetical protein
MSDKIKTLLILIGIQIHPEGMGFIFSKIATPPFGQDISVGLLRVWVS